MIITFHSAMEFAVPRKGKLPEGFSADNSYQRFGLLAEPYVDGTVAFFFGMECNTPVAEFL